MLSGGGVYSVPEINRGGEEVERVEMGVETLEHPDPHEKMTR